jgi:hypothetical protein
VARLPTLTQKRRREILEAIANGNTVEVAARAQGIDAETMALWRQRNKAFNADVEQALAQAEVALTSSIHRAAARGSWHAARYIIERQSGETAEPAPKIPGDDAGDDEAEADENPLAMVDELAAKRVGT